MPVVDALTPYKLHKRTIVVTTTKDPHTKLPPADIDLCSPRSMMTRPKKGSHKFSKRKETGIVQRHKVHTLSFLRGNGLLTADLYVWGSVLVTACSRALSAQ